MNKIGIIIQREFINRVSKKSFILLTILMPFIFAALIFVPLWLSTVKGGDQKQVAVIDATMKYLPQFKDDESWHFVGVPQMEASFRSDSTQFDAVVEIKADLAEHPEAVTIYSRKEVPNSLSRLVSETLDEQVRQDKLLHYDIPQLPSIMQDVNLQLFGDSVLAEASPYDGIWGIRLAASSPEARDPMKWRGQNLLGFALMEVRDELRRVTQNEMMCDWSTVWQR